MYVFVGNYPQMCYISHSACEYFCGVLHIGAVSFGDKAAKLPNYPCFNVGNVVDIVDN